MATRNGEAAAVVERLVDLPVLLARKSHFLLGPRQTGKTFLVRRALPDARLHDLLDSATYLTLSRHPGRIAEELTRPRRVPPVEILPVLDFLRALWAGRFQ